MNQSLPFTAVELPVREVTLSNAGLIQIERAGDVPSEASISFRIPAEDVDDLLKSLVVRDPEGRVEGVRLPAQDLEAEAFRSLPLRPADFESRADLLRALRGQEVEVGGATGRLADAEECETGLRLGLVTAHGLRLLVLREGEQVRLTDIALAARVGRAAEALAAARTADERLVDIHLSGALQARSVGVTYVTSAPLWKPSWRLVIPSADGDARLQGWAVVENRSGVDWTGVRLSLVSGNPAAFHQSLYTPIRVQRPELPVRVAERVIVRSDTGTRPPPPPAGLLDLIQSEPLAMMASAAPPKATSAGPRRLSEQVAPVAAAIPASSAGRVAFTLPGPVTIRSGETANVPFLDSHVPTERLWWVQSISAANPLQAVRLLNATGHVLPDGLATIYGDEGAEAGAYLGDAEIRVVAPDDTRLLAFARDRDVLLSSSSANDERPVRVMFRRATVVVDTIRRDEVALAVDPHGTRGKLVVDLPRRTGATPRFAVLAEGDFGLRHETMLDGSSTVLRFAWEQEGRQEIPLWDAGLGDPVLLRWREVDPKDELRRLPGGPGSLEALQIILKRLPVDAPGQAALRSMLEALKALRGLLSTARTAIRRYAAAETSLVRARAAVADRTGPEQEEARRKLNRASHDAEEAGSAADHAWQAWQAAAQEMLTHAD